MHPGLQGEGEPWFEHNDQLQVAVKAEEIVNLALCVREEDFNHRSSPVHTEACYRFPVLDSIGLEIEIGSENLLIYNSSIS